VRRLLSLGLILGLAACGGRVALRPPQGKSLPPRAYGETVTRGVDALLEPTSQARPARNAELLTRSDSRSTDPFDLPPGTSPAKVPMPPATSGPASDNATAPR
jgi:hypothetical protein